MVMSAKVKAVINDIVSKTNRTFDEVNHDLEQMVVGSKQGTRNVSERTLKLRESINAYIFIHKK